MKRFIGRVVDVADPEQAGRVKIRIFGDHDDTVNLPDSDLPWARCSYPVTNAMSAGVCGPTTGLVKGSIVHGHYWDEEHQIPVIEGTLGRSASADGGRSDFPLANAGHDSNDVTGTNLFEQATNSLKSYSLPSIGSIAYTGQSVTNMISAVSSGDIGAAISGIKSTISAINTIKSQVSALTDPAQLTSLLAGYATDSTTSSGTLFSSSNQVVGSIADRLAKEGITSVQDAINRVNGSAFTMSTTMGSVESAFATIKSIAKKKS